MLQRAAFLCLCMALPSIAGRAQVTDVNILTPGRVLYVSFDISPVASQNQSDVFDPNLIFLEFRGGISYSANAVITATLFIDGVNLGSTTPDFACSPCSSPAWEFAAPGFPTGTFFTHWTTVDFAPVLTGSRGVIALTVDSGSMKFGAEPYTENAPVVVFDNIASPAPGITVIRPVTLDGTNQRYDVEAGR